MIHNALNNVYKEYFHRDHCACFVLIVVKISR